MANDKSIVVELSGQQLTAVGEIHMHISFHSGLQQRNPTAMEVVITRRVGEAPDSPSDQLSFGAMRGNDDSAGIRTKEAIVRFTDPNAQNRAIGEWKIGAAFVESYSIEDGGTEIAETTIVHANKIVYKKDGGPETEILDINRR